MQSGSSLCSGGYNAARSKYTFKAEVGMAHDLALQRHQ